jgi:hypothetical protein
VPVAVRFVRVSLVKLLEANLLPVQLSEAVQVVALAALQESVKLPPELTVLGVAVNVTTGAGILETVTMTVAEALPPLPVQVIP